MPTREPSRTRRLKKAAGLAAFVLLLAAVGQELRKPADAREWHGKVLGVVPYDLRPPSWSRLRSSLWDPGSSRLFPPRAFGVGWSVNLAAVRARLRRAVTGTSATDHDDG